VSRRFVTILTEQRTVLTGTVSSKTVEAVVGDVVSFEERDEEIFVTQVAPASRSLHRSFHGKLKRMGANIDALLVITATGPTFNPVVIDRMLVAAQVQSIPTTLVVNKVDLGADGIEEMLAVYKRTGISVVLCSAKHGQGISDIESLVNQQHVRVLSLCGVSGVGKSTILNKLVPGARTRTGDVSEKTGQGKQTTSQPRGYIYEASDFTQKVIVDLPGVQFFGLSHISPEAAASAFPEIREAASGCRFGDCKHLKEPECSVKDAVSRGDVAQWRYESYRQILEEIEDAREY
jgi:ribosome biogenesis GTPase